MSNAPDLFLGLVTHPASAFNRDNRSSKSLEQLALALTQHGLSVEYLVSDRNDYSPAEYPVTRDSLVKAATAQSVLERDWRDFVNGRAGGGIVTKARNHAMYLGMRSKRTLAALRGKDSAAAKSFQRLINIDLSHLRVLSAGIDSGAAGIVILEDDASMPHRDLIEDLARVLTQAGQQKIDFINLSQSISAPELGIGAIVSRARPVDHGDRLTVIELDTPLTNTVCANYYSNGFAKIFREHISPPNLTPVKPIDWRLNEVMLAHQNTRTWWVEPGVFLQGSMHKNTCSES